MEETTPITNEDTIAKVHSDDVPTSTGPSLEVTSEVGHTFSDVLDKLKQGLKATRACWNRPDVVMAQFPDEHSANTFPYLYLMHEKSRAPWFPSNSDLFTNDWIIIYN